MLPVTPQVGSSLAAGAVRPGRWVGDRHREHGPWATWRAFEGEDAVENGTLFPETATEPMLADALTLSAACLVTAAKVIVLLPEQQKIKRATTGHTE
jgi:hypothetical protein